MVCNEAIVLLQHFFLSFGSFFSISVPPYYGAMEHGAYDKPLKMMGCRLQQLHLHQGK